MRDIDQIVQTHRIAQERRNNGLPIWDRTINIKEIIFRDQGNESPEHAASVANDIAALIRKQVPASWLEITDPNYDADLDELVEGMESLSPTSYAGETDYSVIEDLNNMLTGLYDWADAKRVWLGS